MTGLKLILSGLQVAVGLAAVTRFGWWVAAPMLAFALLLIANYELHREEARRS